MPGRASQEFGFLRVGNEETLSLSVFCINEKTFVYDVQTQGHLQTPTAEENTYLHVLYL